jgi:general secretion pathway protein K
MNKTTFPQRGAILIIVLWFIAIVIVMVTALASEVRLSAKIVLHNKIALESWVDILQALQAAQMEVTNFRKIGPLDEEEDIPLEKRKKLEYRFNGQILELAYPIPNTVTVRIYDHAGKMNIQRITKRQMRQLLENRIGKDLEKLDALEDAWEDWIDGDEMKRANGAEKEYYETLLPPYEPRNAPLEVVEELLLIKGFKEVFKGIEIDTVFTVYDDVYDDDSLRDNMKVNPNLATREALMMIPGLNEETVITILTKRREKDLKRGDLKEFIEPEEFSKASSWFSFVATSNFYTIAIQAKKPEEIIAAKSEDESNATEESASSPEQTTSPTQSQEYQRAYMVTLQVKGFDKLPHILMVNPYGILPDTRHENIPLDEENQGI